MRDTHRQVNRLDVLGQGATGDAVNTGFGNLAQGGVVDVTRSLQRGAPGVALYRFAHLRQSEVIQHDNVGSSSQSSVEFIEVFHLNLYREVTGDVARLLDAAAMLPQAAMWFSLIRKAS